MPAASAAKFGPQNTSSKKRRWTKRMDALREQLILQVRHVISHLLSRAISSSRPASPVDPDPLGDQRRVVVTVRGNGHPEIGMKLTSTYIFLFIDEHLGSSSTWLTCVE
jgi:hypothetical protein